MSCLSMEQLHLYLGKGLQKKERIFIEKHLDTCASCLHKMENEQQRLVIFHEALNQYESGEPSRLRVEEIYDAYSQRSKSPVHRHFWLRTAAVLVLFVASFSLINHFYPFNKRISEVKPSNSMVVNPFLNEQPALTITISTGISSKEAPIFWLEKWNARK